MLSKTRSSLPAAGLELGEGAAWCSNALSFAGVGEGPGKRQDEVLGRSSRLRKR